MFHCLVIKVVCLSSLCDSPFTLSYLSDLVKHFFSKVFQTFKKLYKVVCFCRSVQATWLLYHKFSRLSTVNLNFLKNYFYFFSIFRSNSLRQLIYYTTAVRNRQALFYKKILYFFINIYFKILFLQFITFALRHDSVNTYNKFIILYPFPSLEVSMYQQQSPALKETNPHGSQAFPCAFYRLKLSGHGIWSSTIGTRRSRLFTFPVEPSP